MKKPLVALAAGVGVFALTGAAAATLGVTGFVPQTGDTSSTCQAAGLTATAQIGAAPTWNVTGVEVKTINTTPTTGCLGQELQAVVYFTGVPGIGSGVIISDKMTIDDAVMTLPVGGTLSAEYVTKISVVIAGNIA
jgi:hypothetical protein